MWYSHGVDFLNHVRQKSSAGKNSTGRWLPICSQSKAAATRESQVGHSQSHCLGSHDFPASILSSLLFIFPMVVS